MPVIDSQVHAYERNHPGRPWISKTTHGVEEATGAEHIAVMDAAGVDGALLVSPFGLYGTDTSYAKQVRNEHPDRFAMVAPLESPTPGVGDRIADWAATPGAVGLRLLLGFGTAVSVKEDFRPDSPAMREAVRAAERSGLPICVFCWGKLPVMAELAQQYPDAQFVIDHLGIAQPLAPPAPTDPFVALGDVVELARFPNVAIKISGVATLSHRPYPFDDLWSPLGRVFEAFGIDRCMWGTDWTRTAPIVGYADAVASVREMPGLSSDEREALMGGSLSRIFGWSPR